MSKPYRPSNGTEGDFFMAEFCFRCGRDTEEKPCKLLGNSLAYEIGDPEYPKEWITDEEGSRCTAFTLEGSEEERERFEARRDPRQSSFL